jgi:hypothetical protein
VIGMTTKLHSFCQYTVLRDSSSKKYRWYLLLSFVHPSLRFWINLLVFFSRKYGSNTHSIKP